MMGWLDGCCGFGYFGSGNWIGLILNLLLIIGLVIVIVLVIRWLSRQSSTNIVGLGNRQESREVRPSPREILDIRYARGEIDREQYQEMLSDLN